MLHCDFYVPENAGGHGDDHLYFVCSDIAQCGDVSMDYTPDVELNRMENGTYAVYARGRNEKTAVLQFEGNCRDIQKIADCAKNGAIVISGTYLDGYEPSIFTGVFCYIDGSPNTVTISRKIDLMSISIPVIIRDTDTDVPVARLTLDGETKFSFGGHDIPLTACKYIGGGQYVYEEVVIFPNDVVSAKILGSGLGFAGTFMPEFGMRKSGEEAYSTTTFLPTEDAADATEIPLPDGEFECYVKLDNTMIQVFKPFQVFFKCRRLTENDTV